MNLVGGTYQDADEPVQVGVVGERECGADDTQADEFVREHPLGDHGQDWDNRKHDCNPLEYLGLQLYKDARSHSSGMTQVHAAVPQEKSSECD